MKNDQRILVSPSVRFAMPFHVGVIVGGFFQFGVMGFLPPKQKRTTRQKILKGTSGSSAGCHGSFRVWLARVTACFACVFTCLLRLIIWFPNILLIMKHVFGGCLPRDGKFVQKFK